MLASETKIFLNLPTESKRCVLHPATVKETSKRGYTAELEESDVSLRPGRTCSSTSTSSESS